MPRKIRQLIRDLEHTGFKLSGGKGSHRKYKHPCGVIVVLGGGLGDDADKYEETLVKKALETVRRLSNEGK